MHLAWLLTLCSLVSWLDALSLGGNRLLVVLEEQSEKGKYSKLFDDLKSEHYVCLDKGYSSWLTITGCV